MIWITSALFSKVAQATETPLHITELTDQSLRRHNVEAWIENERIAQDDIVIFYFAGHGYRKWRDRTIWPRGGFPINNETVNFPRLMSKLLAKSAAFYLVVFDSCNEFIGSKRGAMVLRDSMQKTTPRWKKILKKTKTKSCATHDQNAKYLMSLHKKHRSFRENKKSLDRGGKYKK